MPTKFNSSILLLFQISVSRSCSFSSSSLRSSSIASCVVLDLNIHAIVLLEMLPNLIFEA